MDEPKLLSAPNPEAYGVSPLRLAYQEWSVAELLREYERRVCESMLLSERELWGSPRRTQADAGE